MDLENIIPKGGPTIFEVKKYIQKYNKEIIVINSVSGLHPEREILNGITFMPCDSIVAL